MVAIQNKGRADAPGRGRPRFGDQRHVPEALLDAAEAGLRLKSYDELTAREIALSAGTNPAMIQYYFDGKGGLFSALIDKALKQIATELDALETNILNVKGSPTRALIAILAQHYCSHASLYKIVIDELRNEHSGIRRRYFRRGARTSVQVGRILQKLVRAGIYKADTDVRRAVFIITCLISTPISMSPVVNQLGFTLEELSSDAWIDWISALLNREFAATADGGVMP
jgi:AcrR family transcriptional regulator